LLSQEEEGVQMNNVSITSKLVPKTLLAAIFIAQVNVIYSVLLRLLR